MDERRHVEGVVGSGANQKSHVFPGDREVTGWPPQAEQCRPSPPRALPQRRKAVRPPASRIRAGVASWELSERGHWVHPRCGKGTETQKELLAMVNGSLLLSSCLKEKGMEFGTH